MHTAWDSLGLDSLPTASGFSFLCVSYDGNMKVCCNRKAEPMHRHLQAKVPWTTYHKRPDQPGDQTPSEKLCLSPSSPNAHSSTSCVGGHACLCFGSLCTPLLMSFKSLAGTVLTEVKRSETQYRRQRCQVGRFVKFHPWVDLCVKPGCSWLWTSVVKL